MEVTEAINGSWYATVTDADLAPGKSIPRRLSFLEGGRGTWSVDVLDKTSGANATPEEIKEAVLQRIPWANPRSISLKPFPGRRI